MGMMSVPKYARQLTTNIRRYSGINWLVFVLTLILTASVVAVAYRLVALPPVNMENPAPVYNTLSCKITAANPASPPLYLYVFSQRQAEHFLRRLCTDAEVAKQFSSVLVRWQHEAADSLRLFSTEYHLIVGAPQIVEAAFFLSGSAHQAIASYPEYQAALITDTPRIAITPAWLSERRIGLLYYPNSLSGNVLPMRLFHEAGADREHLNIRYYHSHQDLRQALLEGDVDIISTYWDEAEDRDVFRRHTVMLLPEAIGNRWYLRGSLLGSPVHCALEDVLRSEAANSESAYFRNLTMLHRCAR